MPALKTPSAFSQQLKKLTNSTFLSKAKEISNLPAKSQLAALQKTIELLAKQTAPSPVPGTLPGQPFDSHLLALSALYRKSRRLYRSLGGGFSPALLSSGRTLSSASLLTNHIEYSPIEQEMIWTATDPLENRETLFQLRTYCTSVFHEQNHRILWSLLPPPPSKESELRMYLNFAESLVVATDMALGDELNYYSSRLFYLTGVIYHSGTYAHQELGSSRKYRNYLHAAIYSTYLNLEMFDADPIKKGLHHLYPTLGVIADYAMERSLDLDRKFVEITNPFWQEKHLKKVKTTSKKSSRKSEVPAGPFQNNSLPLILPRDPLDNRLLYLWAEKWMDKIGIP